MCGIYDGRGPAVEWYDALIAHFRHSRNVRLWFVQNILFAQPSRLSEYLLESPSSEVIMSVWLLAHYLYSIEYFIQAFLFSTVIIVLLMICIITPSVFNAIC